MKKIALLLIATLLIGGCMSSEEYIKWVDANAQIALMNQKNSQNPILNIEWCGQDKQQICKLQVFPQPSTIPYLSQKKDSEWVGTVNRLLSIGGMVGGIYATGSALKDIVNSVGTNAGHNTTYNDSFNTSGSYNTDSHDTSISGSYNTDRHDINDSYNDRHDINNSYNPVDNHATTNP